MHLHLLTAQILLKFSEASHQMDKSKIKGTLRGRQNLSIRVKYNDIELKKEYLHKKKTKLNYKCFPFLKINMTFSWV